MKLVPKRKELLLKVRNQLDLEDVSLRLDQLKGRMKCKNQPLLAQAVQCLVQHRKILVDPLSRVLKARHS